MKCEVVLLLQIVFVASTAGRTCVANSDCPSELFCNSNECVPLRKVILTPADRIDQPTPPPFRPVTPEFTELPDEDGDVEEFTESPESPHYVCTDCNGACIAGIFCRGDESCIDHTCCTCQHRGGNGGEKQNKWPKWWN